MAKTPKTSLSYYPQESKLQNSECEVHQVGANDYGSQNLSSLGLIVQAVGGAQIFIDGGGGGGNGA